MNKSGLSPLARGTRLALPQCREGQRFIPAGAGNTIPPLLGAEIKTVYPRWRGEHDLPSGVNLNINRFIPAGAGNT